MTVLTDWQMQITSPNLGAVLFGAGTVLNVQGLTGIPGKDEIRITDTPRALRHGYDAGRDLTGARHVSIDLYVDGGGAPATAKALIDQMLAVWHIPNTDIEPNRPLIFKLPGSPQQRIFGRPRKTNAPLDLLKTGKGRLTLEYVGIDPFIYSDALKSQSFTLQQITTGRTYNRVYPMAYGNAVAISSTLTNAGNISAPLVARIVGPCVNPVIENVTTGELVKVNITLLDSTSYLDIDFDAATVLLNGTASRYSLLDSSSTFFDLDPGASAVRFRADSFQPAASATVSWRDTWI